MSYIISEESGTCAALSARSYWGVPLTTSRWIEAEPIESRPWRTRDGCAGALPMESLPA